MGFLDSLRSALDGNPRPDEGRRLKNAWNLYSADEGTPLGDRPAPFEAGEYDRKNWVKKLKLILDDLPASAPRWAEHLADAHALGFDEATIQSWTRDEFALLIRRAVADRVVTEAEHRKLDAARELLEIPEIEAEAILREVAADAERFFGGPVEGA